MQRRVKEKKMQRERQKRAVKNLENHHRFKGILRYSGSEGEDSGKKESGS